ncbi:MAG: hypothetical protein ABFD59_08210 [Smithella sp.]
MKYIILLNELMKAIKRLITSPAWPPDHEIDRIKKAMMKEGQWDRFLDYIAKDMVGSDVRVTPEMFKKYATKYSSKFITNGSRF